MQRFHYPDINYLATAFAEFTATTLCNALTKQQKASLVVPGGNTPRHYLPTLARHALPWKQITVTLSDERWVDVSATASNEHLVRKYLLTHMAEKAGFVGLKTHHANPFEAVNLIHTRLESIPLPFSLTVLGLGEDGHIASLFPGMNPDLNTAQLCLAVEEPIAPSPRISLTLNALASSQNIALVVAGATKRRVLDRLIEHSDPKVPFVWLLQRTQSPISIFETDAD